MSVYQWLICSGEPKHSKTLRIFQVRHNMNCLPEIFRFTSAMLNTLMPRQNGRHFADDIFWPIFLYENYCILTQISLKFVPTRPNNNKLPLHAILAWHRMGDKPLSGPIISWWLLTHIHVTRPRWVKITPWWYLRRDEVFTCFVVSRFWPCRLAAGIVPK